MKSSHPECCLAQRRSISAVLRDVVRRTLLLTDVGRWTVTPGELTVQLVVNLSHWDPLFFDEMGSNLLHTSYFLSMSYIFCFKRYGGAEDRELWAWTIYRVHWFQRSLIRWLIHGLSNAKKGPEKDFSNKYWVLFNYTQASDLWEMSSSPSFSLLQDISPNLLQ